jgi:hypothetical protein
MMSTKRAYLQAMILVFALASTGKADINYVVSRTVGTGSVTGTIETDGTVGTLTGANVVNWNLTLTIPTETTYILTGPLSGNNSVVFETGSDFTATASDLFFNFSGTDAGILLFQTGLFGGSNYYCDSTSAGACFAGETVTPESFLNAQNVSRSGNIIIGTAPTTTTPEPHYWILLSSMLAAVFVARKRITWGSRTTS